MKKKAEKEFGEATRVVKKEMAQTPMAKSAREDEPTRFDK
jgi:hypothetical protein